MQGNIVLTIPSEHFMQVFFLMNSFVRKSPFLLGSGNSGSSNHSKQNCMHVIIFLATACAFGFEKIYLPSLNIYVNQVLAY